VNVASQRLKGDSREVQFLRGFGGEDKPLEELDFLGIRYFFMALTIFSGKFMGDTGVCTPRGYTKTLHTLVCDRADFEGAGRSQKAENPL
jgi:hypothetical protein